MSDGSLPPPPPHRLRIAIVGAGVAGLTAAAELAPGHDITVYEASDWVGGHTHTVDVPDAGGTLAIDTGFIVCNDRTYPAFTALLARLGVALQDSNMSFSLCDERLGLEYNGTSINALFAQRRNLLRPSFLRMIAGILRFNRDAARFLATGDTTTTLGDYLHRERHSPEFVDHYVSPMARAIWSCDLAAVLGFPAAFFIDFFRRHGFLTINDRPQWRVVRGGSREYVRRLTQPFLDRIRLRAAVTEVRRASGGVTVRTRESPAEHYDAVFLACHADQALALLADPGPAEREVLAAFPYAGNEVVLHTDTTLLPRRRLAQAAWNYRLRADRNTACTVTYDMNRLQSLPSRTRYLVSLNQGDRIDPRRVLGQYHYSHPVYTPAGVAAQQRHAELDGANRTFYCGAYWRNGFHEDGVTSALAAVAHFGIWQAEHAERALHRVG